MMNKLILSVLILFSWLSPVWAEQAESVELQVVEPYLDMRTGAGQGYPIFHVVEKGEWIRVEKRHTRWYKVTKITDKPEDEVSGWVSYHDLSLTLTREQQPFRLPEYTFENYAARDIELGVMIGEMDGTSSLSLYGGWIFTENLAAELSYTQSLGDFAENELIMLNMVNHPFSDWTVSPFFSLGIGKIKTSPRSNLVESGDDSRDDDLVSVGGGVSYYLMRNFILKAEYRNYVALTRRNENEEFDEWKLGFAVFF